MQIDRVEVSYGLTYSKNFQGCRVDVRLGANVPPDMNWEAMHELLLAEAKRKCNEAVDMYERDSHA